MLTADRALEGLRRLGLRYVPDVRAEDGAWLAECPRCPGTDRFPKPLRLIEQRNGRVTGECRFCGPGVLLHLDAALRPPDLAQKLRKLELKVMLLEYEVRRAGVVK